MSRPFSLLGPVTPVALAFAISLGLSVSWGATPEADTPTLSPQAVQEALASAPLPGGVSADALAFHEAKHVARPDEPLPVRSLASIHLLRFRAYGDRTELQRAGGFIDALRKRYPEDAGVLSLQAAHALSSHRFRKAVDAARAAAARSPSGDPDSSLRLFDALVASGSYAEAEKLFQRLEPHHVTQGYLSRKARLMDAVGEVGEAAAIMNEVVRMTEAYADPAAVRAWARVESGHFLHHSGNTEAGVERYREALDIVPGYPAALEALGWIAYGVDHDLGAAESLFARAVDNGGHLDLYTTLQEIATARGASERARSYRQTFLAGARAADGWDRMYWRPLALTLAEDEGTRQEAAELAEMDLDQRQDRDAFATLAWILHLDGQSARALHLAERALEWGAPTPPTLHLAGIVFVENGEIGRGKRILREALEGEAELGPVTTRDIRVLLGDVEADAAS